jgi:uncharacterized protein YfaP (DUF2135 family)
MTTWIISPAEATHLYSPVGLRLLDELTGTAPLGGVSATLDILDPGGGWRQTDISDVRTPSAVVTYPGLGRCADVTAQRPQRYRVRLAADLYIPYYLGTADAITFTAYPYNDDNPPAVIVRIPTDTLLVPAPNYPFATHIPVLRGVVVDASNKPVPEVLVMQGNNERTLTDSRGTFALPLRWVHAKVATTIDANDQRTARSGSIQIQLPDALNSNQTIAIS